MDKQKADLIPEELRGHGFRGYVSFEGLSAKIGNELLMGWPNADPEGRQNDSPTMREMVDITLKYAGTLEGYIITVESGREDTRIQFDGFTIKIPKKEALEMKERLKPRNFDEFDQETFRFWWD